MTDLLEKYSWPDLDPYFRLNILLGQKGELVGSAGTSSSLSTPTDRELLKFIRSEADVVLIGAESVRREGWFLPPHGKLAVFSSTSNLPWDLCPDPARVNVISSQELLHEFLQTVSGRVLCEGGRVLAHTIDMLHGFDELDISLRHPEIRNPLEILGLHATQYQLDQQHSVEDEGITFQIWRRGTPRR